MADLSKYDDKTIIDFIGVNAEEELRKRGYEYGWYKKDQLKTGKSKIVGSIYILVNSFDKDLIKIGFSENALGYVNYINEHYKSLINDYHCYAVYNLTVKVSNDDIKFLISALFSNSIFSSSNSDWIEFSKEKAFNILKAIARLYKDTDNLILNPFGDDFFNEDKTDNGLTKVTPISIVISVGDIMEHTDYGEGIVKSIGSDSNGPVYYVEFDNGKTLPINTLTIEDGVARKI